MTKPESGVTIRTPFPVAAKAAVENSSSFANQPFCLRVSVWRASSPLLYKSNIYYMVR